MRAGLRTVFFVSCCLLSRAASADVIWKGNFESGDLSQWGSELNLKTGERTNITIDDATVKEGKHAAKLVVHPDDLWSNQHNRVELHQDGKHTGEGETTYFSWYFYLPADITIHEDIGYWETNGPDYQQSMAFYLDPKNGTQIGFRTNQPNSKQQWSAHLDVKQWHQIAMEIHWSQNAATGKVSVWFDGNVVVDNVAAQTKPNAAALFLQVGYHRDMTQSPVDTIYIDDAREGTSLDDVVDKHGGPEAGSDASMSASSAPDGSADAQPKGAGGDPMGGGGGDATSSAGTQSGGSAEENPTETAGGAGSAANSAAASHGGDSSGCGCRTSSNLNDRRGFAMPAALLVAASLLRRRRRPFSIGP